MSAIIAMRCWVFTKTTMDVKEFFSLRHDEGSIRTVQGPSGHEVDLVRKLSFLESGSHLLPLKGGDLGLSFEQKVDVAKRSMVTASPRTKEEDRHGLPGS